jgi:hypothetical protein
MDPVVVIWAERNPQVKAVNRRELQTGRKLVFDMKVPLARKKAFNANVTKNI